MGNAYLTGNYAPVSEEMTLTELEVRGSIPEHLDGRYVRTGPNPVGEIDQDAYHWFMGHGMVHGVRLRDGRAEWYRNRWVRSEAVAAVLGEPARPRPRSAAIPGFAANTNVTAHGGRTFALVEGGPAPYELTEDLDTVGPCDFEGTVRGGYAAHPKHDPITGEMHAVNYHFGRGNSVQYSVIGLDGRARRTVDVEVGGSPMMHDFALTERYVVFLDLPVVFDPAKGASSVGIRAPLRRPAELVLSALIGRVRVPDRVIARGVGSHGGSNGDLPYSWDDRYPARIGVMPREGDSADLRWFDVDPMYVFHTLGAYEDGDAVVLDAARYHRMFAADPHGPGGEYPSLRRWRLDLRTGRVAETVLDEQQQEFPRFDERLLGARYRYAYTVSAGDRVGEPIGGELLRHDLEAGSTTRRRLGDHAQAGEFVFVPNADDAAEDDGVLMGFVYDADRQRSRLTLLDAASLETVAEIHLPTRVPHGFHGNWLPT